MLQGEKICHTCRKQVSDMSEPTESEKSQSRSFIEEQPSPYNQEYPEIELGQEPTMTDSSSDSDSSSSSDSSPIKQYLTTESRTRVNDYLKVAGETPITKRKLQSKKYKKRKFHTIVKMMERVGIDEKPNPDEEIISQLKEKYSTASRSEKLQILTIVPKSWSLRKIESEFGASNFMARKAKQLVRIFSTPNPKPGRSLPQTSIDVVVHFYESDENSRVMPGKKDCISVRGAEGRITIQKRLILSNLRELYRLFKDKHPEQKIGFSKFAELRPRHCVLAGASGTHSVCVCTIHQNVKLMMQSIKELTTSNGTSLQTYQHCISQAICNPPLPSCYLGTCNSCPGFAALEEVLHSMLDDNVIDYVTFKQWVSVDRSTLDTFSKPADEFVEFFCDKLKLLIPHSFVATQQASFFSERKSTLQTGELIVQADFSENYAFVLQDAVQGFHWNNSQATVHPFVIYYQQSGEECHTSYVIISDCMHHDTIALYLFQKNLITFLKQVLHTGPKKIIYFSDGAASQYKNRKNFVNLCNHETDFGVKAEWHFSATSHGKGACDGVGGTVKRLASRASLQRPYDQQIMTPHQLFEWASNNIQGIVFQYCSCSEYEEVKNQLEARFQASRTIPGMRKFHSFIPVSQESIQVRSFSRATTIKTEKVTKQESELAIDDISGFVTCVYDAHWWLALVLETDKENAELKVTFLHPQGPSHSFKYPTQPDILVVPSSDILTKVNAKTATSHTYTLSRKESKLATEKLTYKYN